MKYEITEESKAEAKRVFGETLDKGFVGSYAFSAALDALLVPVQGEGWVELKESHYEKYKKGKYGITNFDSQWDLWEEKDDGRPIIASIKYIASPAEAQAWADVQITQHECSLNTMDRWSDDWM